MRYEPIPITPDVVKWARIRAGFSLDDAQEIFRHIEAWETGNASPSYPQLEKMADKFQIPVAVFFFPEPPDVPPISESFRTLPEHEFELLPPKIQSLVRKAKSFQIGLVELTGGKNPSAKHIVRDLLFRSNTSIARMVQQVRDYLDISFEEQISWPSKKEALDNWRQILQDVGLYVFKDQFRQTGFSGFCLYDDEFPLIYVNNTSAKSRQIFTLFHELAHLLFHTSGIDAINDDYIDRLPENDQKIEVVCNHFAAEFLLPDAMFEQVVEGREPNEATAEELSAHFHVSREFIFRKFLDRELISQALYMRKAKEWADQRTPGTGGNSYYNKIVYLGRPYINLAFGEYYQNRINDIQLAEYLDTKPKNLSTLEEYVIRGART